MAIQQRFCANHPQTPAIGVCVITKKPICGECSTRYEGVNYSREGLLILQKQRATAASPRRGWSMSVLAWALAPVAVFAMYYTFLTTSELLIELLHKTG